MKSITYLFLAVLFLIFASCGLLDTGDGMPDYRSFSIDRIYSVNLDGSDLKLIAVGSSFTLLSNGKLIYIKDYKLHSCNLDGTDSVIISPDNYEIFNYQFYLNSSKILFIQYSIKNTSVYSMNVDGSGFSQLNLPSNIKFNGGVTISPDGQKMAYANGTGLYIVNIDGSDQRQIKDTANRSYFYNMSFTPDVNNVVYIQDIQSGVALDLRLYNIQSRHDTSLFYNNDGNKIGTYNLSRWNTLLFSNGDGVNLMNLKDYSYTFLHHGGDTHFSYDSTKITFMDFDINAIDVMDLKQNSSNLIFVNLPKNYISNPELTLDGKRVIFQADTSWGVKLNKKMNTDAIH